jgi:carbohydrate-selective porin OprB
LNAIRGVPQPAKRNSWAFYYSAHQYVHWKDDRGWGVFVRFGTSDGEVNPIDWNAAVGIGGKGLFDSRPHDRFGIGYYHINLVDAPVFRLLDLGNEHGVEAFYNVAVTPWLSVTADVQYIDTALGQPLSGLVPRTRFGRLVVSRLNLPTIPESESGWLGALRVKVTF